MAQVVLETVSGATFERRNPLTGDVASHAPAMSVADACAVADRASAAFSGWSQTSPAHRRALLARAADRLEEQVDGFIADAAAELGMTAGWMHFNVHLAAEMLRDAAAMTSQIKGEVIPSNKPGCFSLAVRQPAGVVLGIAPWNAPVILAVRAVAMPLACGNTVILKASELCPALHRRLGDVFIAAGFPADVVSVVSNAPADAAAVVGALVAHRAVRRVNFTGSTNVGRAIAELCARQLKPALLELGGKAPLLVLDDADLDAAVAAAAFGAYMNAGQICMSTERIIVDERVADAFVAKLAAKARTLRAGDPTLPDTQIGSLISRDAAERIEALIADAVSKGATILAGGTRVGTIMEATVVDGVVASMALYRDESFGPVVGITRVNGIDEAVRVANDSDYGLSAAVFGRDSTRALAVAQRIESGICHINGPTVSDEPQIPFGGVKASGYGRFGGSAAIAEFTDLRWITIESDQHYPI